MLLVPEGRQEVLLGASVRPGPEGRPNPGGDGPGGHLPLKGQPIPGTQPGLVGPPGGPGEPVVAELRDGALEVGGRIASTAVANDARVASLTVEKARPRPEPAPRGPRREAVPPSHELREQRKGLGLAGSLGQCDELRKGALTWPHSGES